MEIKLQIVVKRVFKELSEQFTYTPDAETILPQYIERKFLRVIEIVFVRERPDVTLLKRTRDAYKNQTFLI